MGGDSQKPAEKGGDSGRFISPEAIGKGGDEIAPRPLA